jgi:SAM-dependent methyltransferase
MTRITGKRGQLQEELYRFPYHYIPNFPDSGGASRVRTLSWGLEYLGYMTYVASLVNRLEPGSVLDVGCGDGRLFEFLSPAIPKRVGVDPSERAVALARGLIPGTEFIAGVARDVPEQFDVVTAVEVLEHIPDTELNEFLTEASGRVCVGGHFVISVPSTVKAPNPKHYRHYDEELLIAQTRAGAPGLELERIDHVCEPIWFLEAWRKLSVNRWWVFESKWTNRLQWWAFRNYGWQARKGKGQHIVAVFRRT